jgi:hypothetical protein
MRHLILLTIFASGTLLADPVLKFDTSTPNRTNYENEIVGWEFNVLNTIDVTGLGWYDEGLDGLFLAHTVGIYNSSGNLLASAPVLAGKLDPLVGLFRTAGISLTLSPGTYIVAGQEFAPTDIPATNTTDQPAWGGAPNILDSRIAFVGGEFFSTADNKFESTATNCCWGPSFSADAAANVPEPSGVSALLAAGLLAMLVARRTRRA